MLKSYWNDSNTPDSDVSDPNLHMNIVTSKPGLRPTQIIANSNQYGSYLLIISNH